MEWDAKMDCVDCTTAKSEYGTRVVRSVAPSLVGPPREAGSKSWDVERNRAEGLEVSLGVEENNYAIGAVKKWMGCWMGTVHTEQEKTGGGAMTGRRWEGEENLPTGARTR